MQDRAMQKWAEQLRSCGNWTKDQAREVLERQRASGEGITVFARRMGFVAQRLFWWQGRLRQPESAAAPSPSFLPVVVRDEVAVLGVRISVDLGDGVRVLVNELDAATAGWVALLLSARAQS